MSPSRPSSSSSRAGKSHQPHGSRSMTTRRVGPHGPTRAVVVPVQPVLRTTRRTRSVGEDRVAAYPHWFYVPAGLLFGLIFVVPTVLSFYYSMTRWTLFSAEFIGLDNFFQFFREPALTMGARNTIVYAVTTSGLKVII